jgi:hypothetical protein
MEFPEIINQEEKAMTSISEEIKTLESPIDVMYPMHKAYMIHSNRTVSLAEKAMSGGSLTELQANLEGWLKHLLYHAQTEDIYMTGPLKDIEHQDGRRPARDNEKEHDELRLLGGGIADYVEKGDKGALSEDIAALVLSREEEEHANLVHKAENAERALHQALGEARVVDRTRRRLYQKIVEFQVTEFDHFENEEAFVLPLVKGQMSAEQELECSRRLLFDDDSENTRWIIDFIYNELESGERELLKQLESSFSGPAPT